MKILKKRLSIRENLTKTDESDKEKQSLTIKKIYEGKNDKDVT